MGNELRKLAELLRKEAAVLAEKRTIKCAHTLQAASGLALLRAKLGMR